MAAHKTILTGLLSINGAIFINWLHAGEKSNGGDFPVKTLEPPSEILHVPQG
jgi:hypothetical protein